MSGSLSITVTAYWTWQPDTTHSHQAPDAESSTVYERSSNNSGTSFRGSFTHVLTG